jgi:hypothetical protein
VKTPKTFSQWLMLILILGIVAASMSYVSYRFGILKPYQEFRDKEHEIVPLLDALNESVERDLPELPPSSVVTAKSSVGIEPTPYLGHGRWLYVNISTEMSAEDISEYYRTHLLGNGWLINQSRQSGGSDYYYRGTSCIRISLPSQYVHAYEIAILHDFRSQSFSPSLPNSLSMRLFEFEGSNFAVCP